MKNITRYFSFLILVLSFCQVYGTTLVVRGQVKGLSSDDRKAKQIVLEKTKISLLLDDKKVLVKNTLKGAYTFEVKKPGLYKIEVSCLDYNTKTVWLDTRNLPELGKDEVVELTDLDFLLLKSDAFPNDISLTEIMGTLSYNPQKNSYNIDVNNDYRFKNNRLDNSLRLLRKTITYFRDSKKRITKSNYLSASPMRKIEAVKALDSLAVDSMKKRVKEIKEVEKSIAVNFKEYNTLEEIDLGYIQLDSARMKLDSLMKHAVTKEDSLMISKMEVQITLAELNLKMAKETIISQRDQLEVQKRINRAYIIASVVLLLILLFIVWLYRERIKINRELEHKNQLIVDGIRYAETIQSSFLKSREEIQKIIPEFSLFFKPRDIVSGDVYWINEVKGKLVIAAIDCTGHGVPGAFISMIANTLLNEIVNTKGILEPGKILEELHQSFVHILQQEAGEKQAQDGMDMSLMVIDRSLNKILFSGAKNHMYEIVNDEINVLKADFNSIGGRALRAKEGFSKKFNTREIDVNRDGSYFLFSDGFVDQFGGEENKKYNLPNFQDLLIRCSKMPFDEQEKTMEEEFSNWKGENEQLDDVMIMGLKL